MSKPPQFRTMEDVYKSIQKSRKAELFAKGKGLLHMMCSGPALQAIKASESKAVMVHAIMKEEQRKKLERESGEVGGCWWYATLLLTRAWQLQALLPYLRQPRAGPVGLVQRIKVKQRHRHLHNRQRSVLERAVRRGGVGGMLHAC